MSAQGSSPTWWFHASSADLASRQPFSKRDAMKGSLKTSSLAAPVTAQKPGFDELHVSQAYLPGEMHSPVSGQAKFKCPSGHLQLLVETFWRQRWHWRGRSGTEAGKLG